MNYNDRIDELNELAFLDSSADYEVDYVGIYTDGSLFYYISTSGCSCWDGSDWDEVKFENFELLRQFVLNEDLPRFNPSLNGAKELIEQAERSLARLGN